MIITLTLGLVLCAFQNAAPSFTPLGRPATREPASVILVQRGPALRFEVSSLWLEQEELEEIEQPQDSPSEGRKFKATTIQYNSVVVNYTDLVAALTGIATLEIPVEMPLPRDGRFVLVWDRLTGVIDVQMAASAVVVEEGESLAAPLFGDREITFCTTKAPVSDGVIEGGRLHVRQLVPVGDPTPRLSAYPAAPPASFEEYVANPHLPQVALGFFDLHVTGQRIDQAPQYRCSLSTWRDEPGERELCVAKSVDGNRWYIWFDGQMPD